MTGIHLQVLHIARGVSTGLGLQQYGLGMQHQEQHLLMPLHSILDHQDVVNHGAAGTALLMRLVQRRLLEDAAAIGKGMGAWG